MRQGDTDASDVIKESASAHPPLQASMRRGPVAWNASSFLDGRREVAANAQSAQLEIGRNKSNVDLYFQKSQTDRFCL